MPRRPAKPAVGTDAAKRVARTGAQLVIPTLIVQGWNLFASHPLTSEQTNWIIAVGTLLVGFIQNLLEDEGILAGFLKGPPADDLDDRKLDAMAAVIGTQGKAIERLENGLREWRLSTRQATVEELLSPGVIPRPAAESGGQEAGGGLLLR